MPKFRKRLIFQFKENIQRKKERRIDRWKVGQTLFYKTPLATARSPIRSSCNAIASDSFGCTVTSESFNCFTKAIVK